MLNDFESSAEIRHALALSLSHLFKPGPLFYLQPHLDSRLAYPRPRPRLSSFKTKTKTLMSKTKTETQDLQTNTGSPWLRWTVTNKKT